VEGVFALASRRAAFAMTLGPRDHVVVQDQIIDYTHSSKAPFFEGWVSTVTLWTLPSRTPSKNCASAC